MGILDSMNIGANALKVHGARLDIHSKNVANVDTPNYIRKIPLLNTVTENSFLGVMKSMQGSDMLSSMTSGVLQGGVEFDGVVEDPNLGERIYKPGHPDADSEGYIRASNVTPMVEIADAMTAQRAYEANLAVINIAKTMASKATEIGR